MRNNFGRTMNSRESGFANEPIDGIATPREFIFSILIVGVLVALGWIVHTKISSAISDHNTRIQQAVRFCDDEMFRHCLETSPGDAFCEGDLDAVDTVRDEKGHIKGDFWKIVREYQEYREHTRTVTYKDSKGKTHTRIEHYWTWDTMNTHRESCSMIRFCGVKMPKHKIDLSYWADEHNPISIGYHKRYVYSTVPKHHHGTVMTTFENRGMKDHSPFFRDRTPEQVAEGEMASSFWLWLFWIVAVIIIGFIVFWFMMLNNSWLETKGREKVGLDIGQFVG